MQIVVTDSKPQKWKGNSKKRRKVEAYAEKIHLDIEEAEEEMKNYIEKAPEANNRAKEIFKTIIGELREYAKYHWRDFEFQNYSRMVR